VADWHGSGSVDAVDGMSMSIDGQRGGSSWVSRPDVDAVPPIAGPVDAGEREARVSCDPQKVAQVPSSIASRS
jgi:hypothetical protein